MTITKEDVNYLSEIRDTLSFKYKEPMNSEMNKRFGRIIGKLKNSKDFANVIPKNYGSKEYAMGLYLIMQNLKIYMVEQIMQYYKRNPEKHNLSNYGLKGLSGNDYDTFMMVLQICINNE